VVINQRVGSVELDRLAETLQPPCRLGDFVLEGLMARTGTALIFIARGPEADATERVLKLTGPAYAPVLERELQLLNACAAAELQGVVRPLRERLLRIDHAHELNGPLAAIVLPFLSGGDLVQWIGTRATRTGQLGAGPALEVAEVVGGRLRSLLDLPRPIVYGDVKPQNVLLPRPDAPVAELVLIDLDASEVLDLDPGDLADAPRDVAQRLIADVNAFGELLFMLATGREPPVEGEPTPATGNAAFDTLVPRCMNAELGSRGYASMAGDGLWRDLAHAIELQRQPPSVRERLRRPVLALIGLVLLCLLIVAVFTKVAMV
jgi:hypothetical protein